MEQRKHSSSLAQEKTANRPLDRSIRKQQRCLPHNLT